MRLEIVMLQVRFMSWRMKRNIGDGGSRIDNRRARICIDAAHNVPVVHMGPEGSESLKSKHSKVQ